MASTAPKAATPKALRPPAEWVVAAFYHFVQLADFEAMKPPLLAVCNEHAIKGTILLAQEGINGTVAGPRQSIDTLLHYLRADPRLASLTHKESHGDTPPFKRMKVKLKQEIVTMGVPSVDPQAKNGIRLDAEQWHALIQDPQVIVIDTRNHYEHHIGTFANAISPNTTTFREFPQFVNDELAAHKDKPVAMFCTGGIRCEKATSYLMSNGFEQVYHLDGGILKYLETIDADERLQEQSLWQGECFVFDDRVALDRHLKQGSYTQCSACRRPISHQERASSDFEEGISCPYCINTVSDDKKARLAERKRQLSLKLARSAQT